MTRSRYEHSILEWLIDQKVEPFTGPMEWTSNGLRGHLHAARSCDKLTRSNAKVTQTFTVAEARSTRKVCPDCFVELSTGSPECTRVRTALAPLAEIDARIDWAEASAMQRPGFSEIDRLLRSTILAAFKRRYMSLALGDEYQALYHSVGSRLEAAIGRHQVDYDRLWEQVAVAMSLETIDDASVDRRGTPWWSDASSTRTLGVFSVYDNPVRELFKAWEALVPELGPPAAATQALDALRPTLGKWLTSVSQLEELGPVDPQPGETALETVTRAYTTRLDEALTAVMGHWLDKVHGSCAASSPTVFATYDRWGILTQPTLNNNLELLLLKATEVAKRDRLHAAVLPKSVAEWIREKGQYRRLHGEVIDLDGATAEQVDTAVALWEPDTQGLYKDFGAAFAAARNL